MSESLTPSVQPGSEQVNQARTPEAPPMGMTKEAWEKMNLTWGMIEAISNPPSEKAIKAAEGDKGMETIFAMTEGLIQAGERLGIPSDRILSSLDKIAPKAPQNPNQSTSPSTPTE